MPSTNKYRQVSVGRNFEHALRNSGVKRTEVANLLGVHQSSFTYWYKRGVTKKYATSVAELLDVDVKTIASRVKTNRPYAHNHILTKPSAKPTLTIVPEPRTVNLELLTLIANTRLSVPQEKVLHQLAHTFLGDKS